MPRNSNDVWVDIPNIEAVSNQPILSSSWNNYRQDLRDNEFNSVRPIVFGGTGGSSPEEAKAALGFVSVDDLVDLEDNAYFLSCAM